MTTEAIDRGGVPSPSVRFHPYSLLKGIRRPTGGDHYKRLQDALRRLASTYVETNIRVPKGSRKKVAGFHWVEHWDSYEDGNGKPTGMSITLPAWLYEGIVQGGGVLSIHEDYFLLTGGVERWLYRVVRKHAGVQEFGWPSDFALDVRRIVEAGTLPEYALDISRNAEGDEVVSMVRHSRLAVDDARFEIPHSPRRRHGGGITRTVLRFVAGA